MKTSLLRIGLRLLLLHLLCAFFLHLFASGIALPIVRGIGVVMVVNSAIGATAYAVGAIRFMSYPIPQKSATRLQYLILPWIVVIILLPLLSLTSNPHLNFELSLLMRQIEGRCGIIWMAILGFGFLIVLLCDFFLWINCTWRRKSPQTGKSEGMMK